MQKKTERKEYQKKRILGEREVRGEAQLECYNMSIAYPSIYVSNPPVDSSTSSHPFDIPLSPSRALSLISALL